MSIPTTTHPDQQAAAEAPAETPVMPLVELRRHLQRAAQLAADQDVDLEAFMQAAWASFMEARPGLREHLQDLQLLEQIDELRKTGRIPQA